MATAEALMTAEEFGRRPDPGYPEELVLGRVVTGPAPGRRHDEVCIQTSFLLRRFVEGHDVGRVLAPSGVITGRAPDTVRVADVAFDRYARPSKGPLKPGYGLETPVLVVDVRSADERWLDLHERVAEYLKAGVSSVVVLDPGARAAYVFAIDDPPRTLDADEELTHPGLLEGFAVRVGRFFE
jgi:Uma2 family endonuclease